MRRLTVAEYATHLDMALHLQSATEEDIREHASAARGAGVAACYTNSYWTPVVAEVLAGSATRVGTAISFPYGCTSTAMKFAEIDEGLELGATAVDMVVNIGRLRMGDLDFVRREIEGLVARTKDRALSKVIFEVCYLSDEQIATLTRLCSDAGVDYVKTATGSQGFPEERQVRIMRDHITNPGTKLKVSGVPRTFSLAATLWMIEHLGVSLVGTRSAAKLVGEYADFLTTQEGAWPWTTSWASTPAPPAASPSSSTSTDPSWGRTTASTPASSPGRAWWNRATTTSSRRSSTPAGPRSRTRAWTRPPSAPSRSPPRRPCWRWSTRRATWCARSSPGRTCAGRGTSRSCARPTGRRGSTRRPATRWARTPRCRSGRG